MDRFHLVISTYLNLFSFTENFHKIKNFDQNKDKLYIFDNAPSSEVETHLKLANNLTGFGLKWGINLFFIKRRRWGLNEGAFLDYFRCLMDHKIPTPKYVSFLQDHYLDIKRFVKEDTIPEYAIFDLEKIEDKFGSDNSVGCIFFSRYGVRVCVSNPIIDGIFFGDGDELLPDAVPRCFCIDGGNFIIKPGFFLEWFKENPQYLLKGDGSYGFTHVWEVRKCKILYDKAIKWVDMYRGFEYSNIEQLMELESKLNHKISKFWYDNRVWYFFYGRDQQPYTLKPFLPIIKYLIKEYIPNLIHYSRDTELKFLEPKRE
jgi:hypothetical protein